MQRHRTPTSAVRHSRTQRLKHPVVDGHLVGEEVTKGPEFDGVVDVNAHIFQARERGAASTARVGEAERAAVWSALTPLTDMTRGET